jgi:hypothetical protein
MVRVYGPLRLSLLFAAILLMASPSAAQRSSACYENDPNQGCFGRFKGMVNPDAKVFNHPAVDEVPGGPIGISKVSIKEFFRFGEQTPAFVHFMPWFQVCRPSAEYPVEDEGGNFLVCSNGHVEVGYDSFNALIVARQITDISERGFDGLMVDWPGPNDKSDTLPSVENRTAEQVRDEVEARYSTQALNGGRPTAWGSSDG